MFYKSVPILALAFIFSSSSQLEAADDNNHSDLYLGQTPPGHEAELFAPQIISDDFNNRDMAMMPDGSEIYYAINMRNFEISTILAVYLINGSWSNPQVASFALDKNFKYLEPAISPDGKRFFFVKSAKDGKNNNDIWAMDRHANGWGGKPKNWAILSTAGTHNSMHLSQQMSVI